MADDSDHEEGIEDDQLRLIIPLPKSYDPAPLAALAAGGRIAALLLAPGDDPGAASTFAQEHGIAVFVRDDVLMARSLDGVLLTDPALAADARRALPADKLVGALCGIDRHEAMEAGEAGADWILFGRADLDPAKAIEVATWWAELFVLPCGVTGLIEPSHTKTLAAAKISFALPGPSCWQSPDPISLLAELDRAAAAADRGAV